MGPVQLTCTVAQPGSGQTPAGGAGSCSSQSALATPSVCALESCPPPPAQCRDPPSFFGELGGEGRVSASLLSPRPDLTICLSEGRLICLLSE